MSAKCFRECVRHTTTNDQSINFIKKVVDNRDLAGNFSSTKYSYEWSFRIVYSVSEEIDLFLHQISNYCCIYIFGNTNVRAVSSVSCTKCVVYKYVTKRSKFFAEFITILCLFCTITSILKKNDLAVFHISYCCFYCVIYNNRARNEFNFLTEKLCETFCDRCKRKFRFRLSLRFSEMGAKDNLSTICNKLLDCRKSCYQTVLICNFTVLQRYIEVASYEDFLAFYVDVINRFLIQHLVMPPYKYLTLYRQKGPVLFKTGPFSESYSYVSDNSYLSHLSATRLLIKRSEVCQSV